MRLDLVPKANFPLEFDARASGALGIVSDTRTPTLTAHEQSDLAETTRMYKGKSTTSEPTAVCSRVELGQNLLTMLCIQRNVPRLVQKGHSHLAPAVQ